MAALNLTAASEELITVQPSTIPIPGSNDGAGAAWYIIMVVGFFRLIKFFHLISNLCYDDMNEELDTEFNEKNKDFSKLTPKTVPFYENADAFIKNSNSTKGHENHSYTDQGQNKTAPTTTTKQNVTVVVATIT
ncbi:Hypothetical predicted protein [Pelobates cultripes]|uniref:Uncharacterized protein n=1 Tax=Pelobates cultripes TaxID=61616 RepID=A0AAD1QXP2_PELCU|nr:Hypothetical predicted protein [Pelobates cultripes]